MRVDDTTKHLISGLKRADQEAVARLWAQYFEKLVRLARRRLNGTARKMMDEEDVALSVFKSLCLRAARGQFGWLTDRDDLWRILVTLTRRKAAAAIRHERRAKRGGSREQAGLVEFMPAGDPSPVMLASLNDERQRLLAILPDEACRQVARLKMDGETDVEIAARLGIVERTVRRKMKLIRTMWEEEIANQKCGS